MSKPTTRRRKTEKMISKRPKIEEAMMSFPLFKRSGSPDEVRTIALPTNIERKAIPPETLKTIFSIELAKNSGLVERQPKTV